MTPQEWAEKVARGQAEIDHELAVAWQAEIERITARVAGEVASDAEKIANGEG